MLMFSLYTIMDGIFLAHAVGEYALVAINLVMPYINAVFAVAVLFSMGTSTVVAITLGKGDQEKANCIFTQNTWVMLVIAMLFAVLVEIFAQPLALFLGATENTLEYVMIYLRIVAPFTFFFMVGYSLEVLVKTGGHPAVSIISMASCFVANIVLHLVLVVWLDFGVAGGAVATVIAQGIGFAIFVEHFIHKRSKLRFVRLEKPFLGIYKRILSLGLSEFTGEISLALVIFLFNRAAFRVMGEGGLVGYAVLAYVNNIVLMVMAGITQGMQPLVSLFHGKGDKRACLRFYGFALRTVFVTALMLFFACQFFAPGITSLLLERTSALFSYTAHALRIFSFSFLLVGFNLCSAGFLNAMERPGKALVISIGRGIVMITVAVFLMSHFFADRGLWSATSVSEGIMIAINLALVFTVVVKDQGFRRQNESLRS